jgi:hypothetical protein
VTDELDESWRRQIKGVADLAAQPVVEITCLIFPNGAGGSQVQGDALWTLDFTTTAWRQGNGAVRRDALWVRKLLRQADVQPQMQQLEAGTLVRIRARLSEQPGEQAQALLEDVVAVDVADPELLSTLAELRKPVTHQNEVFGILTLDQRVDWYEADAHWCGRTIRISANAQGAGDLEKSLATGHQLWADQATWARRVCDLAVAALLPLKNESWLKENEPALTAAAFVEHMVLESIVLHPDGTFEFYHHDGDLFWGHSIVVSGTVKDGPQRADIVG